MGDFMELSKYNSRYVLRTVESPNFIRSNQAMHIAQCFGILKKLTNSFVRAFLHDDLFYHSCLNINKQLNWNVLQFIIL